MSIISHWRLLSYASIFIPSFLGLNTPPSGHIPREPYECSDLTREHDGKSFVYYFEVGKKSQWGTSSSHVINKLSNIPCGESTSYKCFFKSKIRNTCKRYVINGIQWGPYKSVSQPENCSLHNVSYSSGCALYPLLSQMDSLFTKYINIWSRQIQPWISYESWLFDYLPNYWPEIPRFNRTIQYKSTNTSQLWACVLVLNLDEITFRTTLTNDASSSTQAIKRGLFVPLKSKSGKWVLKLKISTSFFLP